MSDTVFIRLLADDDKENALNNAIASFHDSSSGNSKIYTVNPESFRQVPGSPFAYWVSDRIRQLFTELPSFESEGRVVRQGLATGDDFRFIRLWWEVVPEKIVTGTTETTQEEFRQQTFEGKQWVPFAKGGEYSPYYADMHLIINWEKDGDEIKTFKNPQTGKLFSRPQNTDFYFRMGLTYPRRTQKGLNIRVYPAGCIFADKGPAIFVENDILTSLLGLTNSNIFQTLVSLQMAFGSYEVGVIQRTPVSTLSKREGVELDKLALSCVDLKRSRDRVNELSYIFSLPRLLQTLDDTLANSFTFWQETIAKTEQRLSEYQYQINSLASRCYEIDGEDKQTITIVNDNNSAIVSKEDSEDDTEELSTNSGQIDYRHLIADLISYTVGCTFGRWDIRFATGEKPAPELPDPFAPLPACSPGMLTDKHGLPLRETPPNYPIQINWNGILIDDPDHPDDIIRRVRDVLEVIWGDKSEAIEKEACKILEVKELRDYFRKPGNGGFWSDHIKRYSKSRRKAPIYWLLQSSKKNYAIWIYYHRLDKDILFKALVNYVEPKLRLEEGNLEQLRSQKTAAGTAGIVKQLEKQIDRQESLISELQDFQDKLRRAANLNLEPDLNDGVVLNIAPLWELVPWHEAKKYWLELTANKYEWSSMGKQLKAKGLIP